MIANESNQTNNRGPIILNGGIFKKHLTHKNFQSNPLFTNLKTSCCLKKDMNRTFIEADLLPLSQTVQNPVDDTGDAASKEYTYFGTKTPNSKKVNVVSFEQDVGKKHAYISDYPNGTCQKQAFKDNVYPNNNRSLNKSEISRCSKTKTVHYPEIAINEKRHKEHSSNEMRKTKAQYNIKGHNIIKEYERNVANNHQMDFEIDGQNDRSSAETSVTFTRSSNPAQSMGVREISSQPSSDYSSKKNSSTQHSSEKNEGEEIEQSETTSAYNNHQIIYGKESQYNAGSSLDDCFKKGSLNESSSLMGSTGNLQSFDIFSVTALPIQREKCSKESNVQEFLSYFKSYFQSMFSKQPTGEKKCCFKNMISFVVGLFTAILMLILLTWFTGGFYIIPSDKMQTKKQSPRQNEDNTHTCSQDSHEQTHANTKSLDESPERANGSPERTEQKPLIGRAACFACRAGEEINEDCTECNDDTDFEGTPNSKTGRPQTEHRQILSAFKQAFTAPEQTSVDCEPSTEVPSSLSEKQCSGTVSTECTNCGEATHESSRQSYECDECDMDLSKNDFSRGRRKRNKRGRRKCNNGIDIKDAVSRFMRGWEKVKGLINCFVSTYIHGLI